MSIHLKRWSLLEVAGALLLAGCSARSEVGSVRPVHASAAQRIELAQGAPVPPLIPGATPTQSFGRPRLSPVPEEIRLPDGTVGVKVSQQYFHTIVVCRQSDGTFSTQCPANREPRP